MNNAMRAGLPIVLLLFSSLCVGAAPARVTLVTDEDPGRATVHGLKELRSALEAKGVRIQNVHDLNTAQGDFIVAAGLSRGKGAAARLTTEIGSAALSEPESLSIQKLVRAGGPTLLVTGADDRGLMYALLDVAESVGYTTNSAFPFSAIGDALERPAVAQRALSIYTFQRAAFEQRFFDEACWERYFDMLARDRFNTFVLIFGYENGGYFAPAYPWFFPVKGYPRVAVPGLTAAKQKRNLRALNRMIELAHDRGLQFHVGLWDHIYRGGVQSGGLTNALPDRPGPDRVWGLNQTNLLGYSRAGLSMFLKVAPGVDGIQFRMHDESGLKPGEEQHRFWKMIFEVVEQERPDLPLTLRAKGLPDEIIALGLDMGLNIRVATKYWMEQMGLPFHPTHIPKQNQFDRRHGYADLLRYPQRYKMHWRLWSGGTTRILLWGDPEFARRFAESSHLYDGDGFEVTEPLGTKMQAQPHDEEPFHLLQPQHRYYDYEFERYWHFYQVFGRMSFNPKTPVEIWRREFVRRFGPQAAPFMETALHRASWILPRITASVFPYRNFPTTRGWAEKQRWGDLPEYASTVEGSDTEQFLGIDEWVRDQQEGIESAKLPPWKTALWFDQVARDVLDSIDEAEQRVGAHRNREFDSTVIDLRILAHLARYHSERIHAGTAYASFIHTDDPAMLDGAIQREQRAIGEWELVVKDAGSVYTDDLKMGRRNIDLCGHWRDELTALKQGLEALEEQRRNFQPRATNELTIAHVPARIAPLNQDLALSTAVFGPTPIKSVKVVWRVEDAQREFPMKQVGPYNYSVVVPSVKTPSVTYTIIAEDTAGAHAASKPIPLLITGDIDPPALQHAAITTARPGEPLHITARVRDSSGVKWVRLRYRSVTQFEDYRTLEMQKTETSDEYETTVPGDQIVSQWDFMYFFEVMDNAGNGRIYPEFEKETPYVVVKLNRE